LPKQSEGIALESKHISVHVTLKANLVHLASTPQRDKTDATHGKGSASKVVDKNNRSNMSGRSRIQNHPVSSL